MTREFKTALQILQSFNAVTPLDTQLERAETPNLLIKSAAEEALRFFAAGAALPKLKSEDAAWALKRARLNIRSVEVSGAVAAANGITLAQARAALVGK